MVRKFLAAAALAAMTATTAQAAPIKYSVFAEGLFEDTLSAVGPIQGKITGSFTVDDANSDGLVQASEVTEFDFESVFAADSGLSFTMSSLLGVVDGTDPTTGADPIGGGLSVRNLDFDANGLFEQVIFLNIGIDGFSFGKPSIGVTSIDSILDSIAIFELANPTITVVDPVPVPAPIALMISGVVAFGFVARRRAAKARG